MGMEEIEKRKDEILALATKYGASDVRVFGSVARGEADDKSDVVTEKGLHWYIRDKVLKEARPL